MEKVEQYRVFELEVPEGVTAVTFRQGDASAEVHTFSDGPARTLARFHLLRLDAPAGGTAAANPGKPARQSLQQSPDVRVPQIHGLQHE